MTLENRIAGLEVLRSIILDILADIEDPIYENAKSANQWFTIDSIRQSFQSICEEFLDDQKVSTWVQDYSIVDRITPLNIGIIAAGNLPLVCFHDVLCVFISGNKANIKLSEKDNILLPAILKRWSEKMPTIGSYFIVLDRLLKVDAIIATGSDSSAGYFQYYFGKYPHIIRKSRTSVAIIYGDESEDELSKLGIDVFSYFGMGCRNVTNILIPQEFEIDQIAKSWLTFDPIMHHNKYRNNYDFHLAILMLNKVQHLAGSNVIYLESREINSRVATLHYMRYNQIEEVEQYLKENSENIQCVMSKKAINGNKVLDFGQSQTPGLSDYADQIDTLHFLINL